MWLVESILKNMCQVSEKIKFCSCATKNAHNLKHYWVWHQYNKEKNLMIVGEVYLPNFIVDTHKKINKTTILNRLTETEAFDKVLEFKNKDILQIVLNNAPKNDTLTYCFQFKNGTWKSIEYCYFSLVNNFDEKEHGKLKQPIKK